MHRATPEQKSAFLEVIASYNDLVDVSQMLADYRADAEQRGYERCTRDVVAYCAAHGDSLRVDFERGSHVGAAKEGA